MKLIDFTEKVIEIQDALMSYADEPISLVHGSTMVVLEPAKRFWMPWKTDNDPVTDPENSNEAYYNRIRKDYWWVCEGKGQKCTIFSEPEKDWWIFEYPPENPDHEADFIASIPLFSHRATLIELPKIQIKL